MQPDSTPFVHNKARLSTGRTYYYIDQSPRQPSTTLLCLHGFPDLWYGWRHQILPWVAQGYRVIVPHMLGYGKTDMPLEASAYSMKRICDDLAALLDHLGVQAAVVIGHDWGSFTASRFALWYPNRLLALAMLSLPYTPPSIDYVPLDEVVRRYPSYGYQLYFASDESTTDIEAHLSQFFRVMFRVPKKSNPPFSRIGELRNLLLDESSYNESLLNDKELDFYVSNFQRGVIGPLSYYRTSRVRFDEEKDAALPSNVRSDLPVLFVYGTEDVTCPPVAVQNMGKFIDQLKVVPVSGVSHWVMLQAPEAVTEAILEWLGRVEGAKASTRL